MALFEDGPISSPADLQNYENAILSVANTENINLGVKIMLAQNDVGNQLRLLLRRRAPLQEYACGVQPVEGLKHVVVTQPLQEWHALKTLALVYRDAYNNQLNDRYKAKWAEYETLAKAGAQIYFQIGVGMVADPVPKPGPPILSSVEGAAAGGTFFVATTWVNNSAQEGMPSEPATLTTTNGQQLVVTVSNPPPSAVGWNVYVGTSPSTFGLQNQTPIVVTAGWTMTELATGGVSLSGGQKPEWFMRDDRVMQRG